MGMELCQGIAFSWRDIHSVRKTVVAVIGTRLFK